MCSLGASKLRMASLLESEKHIGKLPLESDFTKIEPDLLEELASLTKSGYDDYGKEGYIAR